MDARQYVCSGFVNPSSHTEGVFSIPPAHSRVAAGTAMLANVLTTL